MKKVSEYILSQSHKSKFTMYAFGCNKPNTLSELEHMEACHRQWEGRSICVFESLALH